MGRGKLNGGIEDMTVGAEESPGSQGPKDERTRPLGMKAGDSEGGVDIEVGGGIRGEEGGEDSTFKEEGEELGRRSLRPRRSFG